MFLVNLNGQNARVDSASKRFQKRLVALRKKRKLTQEEAAELCGISYKLWQLYEIGKKDNPGLKTLEKISLGFGVELSDLVK